MRKRIAKRARAEGGSVSRLAPAELELQRGVARINEASADQRVRAFLRRSTEGTAALEVERPLDDAAPAPGLLNPSGLSETRVFSPTVQLPVGAVVPSDLGKC